MLLHFFYRHLHVYPSHKVERAAGAASKNNCGGSPPNRIPSKNFSNTRNGYRRQLFNDPRLTDKFESYCSESLGYFVEYAALIKYALLHLKVYLLSCFRTHVLTNPGGHAAADKEVFKHTLLGSVRFVVLVLRGQRDHDHHHDADSDGGEAQEEAAPHIADTGGIVGLRIVVGVIRRSNGKPLGRSGFVGFGQICRELQKNPGGVAVQCLRGLFR